MSVMDLEVPFLYVYIRGFALRQGTRCPGEKRDGGAYILKLPPTKNLRAMIAVFVVVRFWCFRKKEEIFFLRFQIWIGEELGGAGCGRWELLRSFITRCQP